MVLHVDIDCFYCSAERLLDKNLLNIPMAVGGQSGAKIFGETPNKNDLKRGVIVTSSYEAREKGIKTGMLIGQALGICPRLVIRPPNHKYYKHLSKKLENILMSFSPVVESLSIDEFFCDLHGLDIEYSSYAKKIKEDIFKKIGLPVSIGVAPTKWIAKLATEDAKPDGVRIVYFDEIDDFIDMKPLKLFPGMGKQMQAKLNAHGIYTLGEVAKAKHLFSVWGEGAFKLYERVVGQDKEVVLANKPRKSIGLSRTFSPISDRKELRRRVLILARHVSALVLKQKSSPRSYSLTLRYEYGSKVTHQVTKDRLFSDGVFKEEILSLLNKCDTAKQQKVVYLGLSASRFNEEIKSSNSLLDFESDKKQHHISKTLQQIRNRYGVDSICFGAELEI